MDKFIAVCNLLTGVSITIFAPIIALVLSTLILPLCIVMAASEQIRDSIRDFMSTTRDVVYWGIRISEKGFKRLKDKTND